MPNMKIYIFKTWVFLILFFYFQLVSAQTSAFLEEDGLLVIEIESVAEVAEGWSEETVFEDYTGSSYFRYASNNQLNNPGNGLLEYPIFIQTPGLYQFQWRNLIAEGDSTTDYNDSWLKILASSFYGQRTLAGGVISIVCPKGYDPVLNDCPVELDEDLEDGVDPEGSGSGGWFKAYRSGEGGWVWSTRTSDSDAHNIYTEFESPGIYMIQVSGRSMSHAIDRMVLYRTDYNGDPLDAEIPESQYVNVDLIFMDGFE